MDPVKRLLEDNKQNDNNYFTYITFFAIISIIFFYVYINKSQTANNNMLSMIKYINIDTGEEVHDLTDYEVVLQNNMKVTNNQPS
jgi:hypothetical protein